MPVKIIGNYAKPARIQTGFYSLDQALMSKEGEIGVPVGVGYEVFGLNYTGKSTFCYSLAAIMARELKGNIALADFEGFDDGFLTAVVTTQGFDGEIHVISKQEDEEQLDGLITSLNKKCDIGILDSIGAISPISEAEGDLGEANMGRRGLLMGQFSRKCLKLFRFENNKKTVLMINHWYPNLGAYGYRTPGGEVLKYIATVRIKLKTKEEFPEKSSALLGEVMKNRWGYKGGYFHVFNLAGFGLHRGMSAVWDCVMLKIVKRVKGELVYEGEKLGKLGQFARQAKEGKEEVFEPFYTMLEEHGKATVEDSDLRESTTDMGESEESENMGD